MYNTSLNNYHLNKKNSTIYTPKEVSEFIFNLLKDKIEPKGVILDPCCGKGSLLTPWEDDYFRRSKGGETYGIDIKDNKKVNLLTDFFTLTPYELEHSHFSLKKPALILCNPPFNGMKPKLAPEVWLDKIIELFGKDIPLVLFAPIGLRCNNNGSSKRLSKWVNHYPPLSSVISLPRDIFKPVLFHTEILIFNIPHLNPHYFYQPNHD